MIYSIDVALCQKPSYTSLNTFYMYALHCVWTFNCAGIFLHNGMWTHTTHIVYKGRLLQITTEFSLFMEEIMLLCNCAN